MKLKSCLFDLSHNPLPMSVFPCLFTFTQRWYYPNKVAL
jgi:hypothetical protein